MLIRESRIEYDHVIDSRARAGNYKVVGDHTFAKTLISLKKITHNSKTDNTESKDANTSF